MELKPVSIVQKESLVTLLIDNIPIQISTNQYNHLLEWIDRYHKYQIGMEIYPLESNIYKQYAIKSKLALETLKKLKNELQKENQRNPGSDGHSSQICQSNERTSQGIDK